METTTANNKSKDQKLKNINIKKYHRFFDNFQNELEIAEIPVPEKCKIGVPLSDEQFELIHDKKYIEKLGTVKYDVECDECGSDSFHLKYGEYEIFAICVVCGTEESVYQG